MNKNFLNDNVTAHCREATTTTKKLKDILLSMGINAKKNACTTKRGIICSLFHIFLALFSSFVKLDITLEQNSGNSGVKAEDRRNSGGNLPFISILPLNRAAAVCTHIKDPSLKKKKRCCDEYALCF